MGTCAVLSEALALGGKVIFAPPDPPRLLVPKGMGAKVQADAPAVREVLRRAAIFHQQAERFIRRGGVLPVLALPDCPAGPCASCGSDLDGNRYRCSICVTAVNVALGVTA
jgi:hypothetical protein